MPLDAQIESVMEQVAALGFPPSHTVSAQEARSNAKARPRGKGPDVHKVEDIKIPSDAGPIPARIYTPSDETSLPVLVWFHGGGWVVGDLESADATARHLCNESSSVIISIDYRLAPETKFPGASDDCYAATQWVSENASSLNADPDKIAVGGDSAGGNLAAVVSLMARDKQGPKIGFQLLVYPVTEMNFNTKSYIDNAEGYQLSRDGMIWYWDHYLEDKESANNPYAAPMKAQSLQNLPPALIITAEYDPLRDEGKAYAERLKAEGVTTQYTMYSGMIHGFFGMASVVDKGRAAVKEAADAMRKALDV